KTRRLDRALSRSDGFDQPDRVLLSARSPAAVAYRRHHFIGGPGGRDPCALCLSPRRSLALDLRGQCRVGTLFQPLRRRRAGIPEADVSAAARSEEHTSELQSRGHLVCRLLLEKKKAEYS